MSCTRRMDQGNGDFSAIPSSDCLIRIQSDARHTLFDALYVMSEPIRHEERFAVHALDDVLQGIEFAVMYMQRSSIVGVDCAVCHLREFPGQDSGICRRHLITLSWRTSCSHIAAYIFRSASLIFTVYSLSISSGILRWSAAFMEMVMSAIFS